MGKGSQNKLSSLETEPTTASESTSVITANNDSSVDSKLPFYDWDEIKKHSKRDDVWIVINDNVYDVTQFRKIHPGGSKLLNFYGGQDATEVFNAFHKEFDRVNKQSKIYKIGRVAPDQLSRHTKEAEIKRDFEELKQKAIKMNLFQPSYFFFFLQGVQILFFHIMGYVILAYYSHSIFGILASLLFLIIAQGQASWSQHDYGHSSLFFKPRYNRYLQGLFLGIVKGGSPEWWTAMHNQHHAKPNVINKDPDVRTDPLFVLGNVQPIKRARKDAKQHKYLYSYDKQHFLFPIVAPLLFPVYFQIMTFRYVLTRKCYRDLFYMLPHYISHFVTTYLIFQSVGKTYAFFLAARLTESAWFAWVSQCNHICMDVHEDAANDTWLNLQLVGTCNLEKSAFNDWFTGHLNFQIEHHLFPTMPRHNLYKIAPEVQKLCQKHGINYVVKPMGQAFLDILLSMKKSGEMWREAYQEITVSSSS